MAPTSSRITGCYPQAGSHKLSWAGGGLRQGSLWPGKYPDGLRVCSVAVLRPRGCKTGHGTMLTEPWGVWTCLKHPAESGLAPDLDSGARGAPCRRGLPCPCPQPEGAWPRRRCCMRNSGRIERRPVLDPGPALLGREPMSCRRAWSRTHHQPKPFRSCSLPRETLSELMPRLANGPGQPVRRFMYLPHDKWKQDGPPYATGVGRAQATVKSNLVWTKLMPSPAGRRAALEGSDAQRTRWLGN